MVQNLYGGKKRLNILKEYKRNVLRFGLVNIFAMFLGIVFNLIFLNNYFITSNLVLSFSILALWFISFFVFFKFAYNKNFLLWIASLLLGIYAIVLDDRISFLIFIIVIYSFVYEIIIRFWAGIEINFKFKELPWHFSKENKKRERTSSRKIKR